MNVNEVGSRVREILKAAGCPFTIDGGKVRVEFGSSAVFVSVQLWQDRYAIVDLLCPLVAGATEGAPLLERLNELNQSLYFGRAYVRDGEVFLAHTLLGDHLDSDELTACVKLMAVVADQLDDELKTRFGGRRWREEKH